MSVCICMSRHIHMHNIVLIPVPNFNSKHSLISALFLLALSELLLTQNIPHIVSILVAKG